MHLNGRMPHIKVNTNNQLDAPEQPEHSVDRTTQARTFADLGNFETVSSLNQRFTSL